jgi:hyperosmotically inducible periplasmic protein
MLQLKLRINYMKDEQIKKNIIDQLSWDSRIDASDISIEVNNGQVILTGSVPSYFAKQAVIGDIWCILGVKEVDDELIVRYIPKLLPDEEEIKSNIETVLKSNPSIDETKINISVKDGDATLEGSVVNYWEKYRAEELASDQLGVFYVNNKLAVVPTKSISDEMIATSIINSLERNVNVKHDLIEVKVENGHVELYGKVPNFTSYTSAHNTAFYTIGVRGIDNQLIIGQ